MDCLFLLPVMSGLVCSAFGNGFLLAINFHFFFDGLLSLFSYELWCNEHDESLDKLLSVIWESIGPATLEIFRCFSVRGPTTSVDSISLPLEVLTSAALGGSSMNLYRLSLLVDATISLMLG